MIVIILAAGFGTRMLPATKSIPKELLPIINRPSLDFILDEIEETHLKNIIIVNGKKPEIPNYNDRHNELEFLLSSKKKIKELEEIKPRNLNISYIRQIDPLGTGHAVLKCKNFVENKPMTIIMPDMIINNGSYYLKKMLDIYRKTGKGVVALSKIPIENASNYGVVKGKYQNNNFIIKDVIEKPKNPPSNLILVGRYVLPNRIFKYIDKLKLSETNEYYLTDALKMLAQEEKIIGVVIDDVVNDIGNPLGYLKTNIFYGIKKYPEIKQYIKSII